MNWPRAATITNVKMVSNMFEESSKHSAMALSLSRITPGPWSGMQGKGAIASAIPDAESSSQRQCLTPYDKLARRPFNGDRVTHSER